MDAGVERVVSAIVASVMRPAPQRGDEQRHPLVVTVSRSYGSGGKQVAQALAERFGLHWYDRDILQEVARMASVDTSLVRSLDEQVKRIKDDWWHALVDGKTFSREQYYQNLAKVILGISRTSGGVIVGRGAHLLLGYHGAFRVRIIGSLSHCALRIAEREGLDLEQARQRVRDVDQERSAYIRELYGVDCNEPGSFDLALNSDRYDVAGMVDIILCCMQKAGYSLPEENRESTA